MDTRQFTFGRVAPTIPVTDIQRAVNFYVGVLGFEKTFENGTPVGFVILRRDAAELHLTLDLAFSASSRNIAHILVDDAISLYKHLEANGVRMIKGLRDADYGLRDFIFADPDGNRLDIGQVL